jgi:hypothetical protein
MASTIVSVNQSLDQTTTELNGKMDSKAYKTYASPEDYGAKGDYFLPNGSTNPNPTDDTDAIQQCLNENPVTHFSGKSYMINKTIVLPPNHSIEGNHCELRVGNNWTPSTIGPSVPSNTVLFVQGRDPIWESELDMNARFVRNLRIRGNSNFTNTTGMYLGAKDQSEITQVSSINYSVFGVNFDNIAISYVNNALTIAEAWVCNFNNIYTSKLYGTACYIVGQIVNNTFLGCKFTTSASGGYGVYIIAGTYNGEIRQSEGNTFIGGFIGDAQNGIRIDQALAVKFSNIIIDLNANAALVGGNVVDVTFENCYLYAESALVQLSALSSVGNYNFLRFSGCNFAAQGTANAFYAAVRQNGIIIDGCMMKNQIYFDDGCSGTVQNCMWMEDDDTTPRIVHNGTGIVVATNNTFKYSGNPVVTSGTQ